jgi:hypothetical protein
MEDTFYISIQGILKRFIRFLSNYENTDRNRVVLDFKRVVIKEYFDFLNAPRVPVVEKDNEELILLGNQGTDSTTDHDSSENEEVKDSRQVKSIKSFLNKHNSERSEEHQLYHGCVFKWLAESLL